MKFEKADIIFTAPQNIGFKLSRWWTKDDFGHVAICVGYVGNEPLIIEATARGIDINAFKWRTQTGEPYAVYRIPDLTEKDKEILVKEAMKFVGRGYDFLGLANFIFKKPKFHNDKRNFCSDMMFRILVKLHYLKTNLANPKMVSPQKIRELIEKFNVAKCRFNSFDLNRPHYPIIEAKK